MGVFDLRVLSKQNISWRNMWTSSVHIFLQEMFFLDNTQYQDVHLDISQHVDMSLMLTCWCYMWLVVSFKKYLSHVKLTLITAYHIPHVVASRFITLALNSWLGLKQVTNLTNSSLREMASYDGATLSTDKNINIGCFFSKPNDIVFKILLF